MGTTENLPRVTPHLMASSNQLGGRDSPAGGGSGGVPLQLGSWNVTRWVRELEEPVLELGCHVLAVQPSFRMLA